RRRRPGVPSTGLVTLGTRSSYSLFSAGADGRGSRRERLSQCAHGTLAWAAPTRPSPSPAFLVSIVTVTERPGRSRPVRGLFAGSAIRTGKRCTILVKFPVALSGGCKLNWAPHAG